ncbi:MAG TPA: GNAT family N-acetyltransferase [Candidatus Polarisedimenticolia bacterium]|jgi:ribosomal protein S18 acetylase RimI-like enzyme|nr:GNAT family N-acetyltransferase [Candidatus Polarisedimenticolia bacterium]
MKNGQDSTMGGQRSSTHQDSLARGIPRPSPRRPAGQTAARPAVLRVVIRPARPDDLEEATLIERRVWGRLGASLNELQRRLFALPEAFLLAELQRPGQSPRLVGLTNGLLWTRDFPRTYLEYERALPSASHNPRGDVLYLASLGVDADLRGHGIGLRLLQETIEVGRRRHLKQVRLIASSRSRPLCERAGLTFVRPLPRLFRQHRDLMPQPVLMELLFS